MRNNINPPVTEAQYRRSHTLETATDVFVGDTGVKVRGPYYRFALGDDGRATSVRKYYRLTAPKSVTDGNRTFKEYGSKAVARQVAREIDENLRNGYAGLVGLRRKEPISMLLDAYLDPRNHEDWKSPRSAEAPRSFVDTWVRPVIGTVPCIEWTPELTRRVLEGMELCEISLSYRKQAHMLLKAVVNFGKRTNQDFFPPKFDPFEGVSVPKGRQTSEDAEYIDRTILPEYSDILVFADGIGETAMQRWLKRGEQTPERLEMAEFDRFRWSMLPWVACTCGARVGELLALRTTDFDLSDRNAGLRVQIARQKVRNSSTETKEPKYGSVRETVMPDWMWDDTQRLISEVEARFGTGALLWTPMHDPDRMLDDSTLYKTMFEPAALQAGWSYTDVPQWGVDEDESGSLIAVPLKYDNGPQKGTQKTKRSWEWTWRHLRHMYGTYGIMPVEHGGFGMNIVDLSACMGHANIETTLRCYVDSRRDIGVRMSEATRGRDPRQPRPQLKSA